MIALTGEELMAWVDKTTIEWQELLEAHPHLLAVPCDIREVKTAGELVQHIVAVQLRYAERLAGRPETAYEAIPYGTVAELYATHVRSMALLRQLLADPGCDWNEELELTTRSMGTLVASRKTVLVHALMHSIRHYAQLATLARQHGVAPKWQMDYLLMGARRA